MNKLFSQFFSLEFRYHGETKSHFESCFPFSSSSSSSRRVGFLFFFIRSFRSLHRKSRKLKSPSRIHFFSYLITRFNIIFLIVIPRFYFFRSSFFIVVPMLTYPFVLIVYCIDAFSISSVHVVCNFM